MKLNDIHCRLHHTIDEHPQETDFFKHFHMDYEFLYFVRGHAEYNIEGVFFTLHPHDLVLIRPKQYHYLHLLSDATYERYCINFEKCVLPTDRAEQIDSLPGVINIAKNERLRDCFDRLHYYTTTLPEGDARLMLRGILREILLNCLCEAAPIAVDGMRRNSVVDSIIRLIDANPEIAWSAERLSQELFLSKSHIQNTFSRYMEIGLKTYINNKKILYAQSLLQAGERPADVCETCGFHDYSTFYRLFRKITGHSPMAIGRE